jgi:hypothetical protein
MPEPRINPQFPVWASDNLSPPIVQPPIHPCALAVFVYGFVPGATVRMYANSSELVGQDEPVVGFATLKVSLPLSLGRRSLRHRPWVPSLVRIRTSRLW